MSEKPIAPNTITLGSERPLTVGEVFDRAINMVFSRWQAIVPTSAIALSPSIAFYYYATAVWVRDAATGAHDDPYSSSFHTSRDVAIFVLQFVAVAVCAVIVAEARKGRFPSALDALKTLTDVWATAVITGLACGAIRYGVQAAAEGGYESVVASLSPLLRLLPIVYDVCATLALGIEMAAAFVVFSTATAVALEVTSIRSAFILGISAAFSRGRALWTLLICVAFAILFRAVPATIHFALALLRLNGVPIIATFVWAVQHVLVWSIFSVVVIIYYLDARLRRGVVLPEAFIDEGAGEL